MKVIKTKTNNGKGCWSLYSPETYLCYFNSYCSFLWFLDLDGVDGIDFGEHRCICVLAFLKNRVYSRCAKKVFDFTGHDYTYTKPVFNI